VKEGRRLKIISRGEKAFGAPEGGEKPDISKRVDHSRRKKLGYGMESYILRGKCPGGTPIARVIENNTTEE